MARQTRNIYCTNNPELDRILNDIAARLDIIEGLRPDLSQGYYNLDQSKNISTADLTLDFYSKIDNVAIGSNYILITSVDGNSIYIDGKMIEIKDENGAVTFRLGNWS